MRYNGVSERKIVAALRLMFKGVKFQAWGYYYSQR